MKIKKVEFINNDIFGDLVFDFCDEAGNVIDNIILAGENGSGKSTLKNYIYEFTGFVQEKSKDIRNEKRIFETRLTIQETMIVKGNLKETENFSEYIDIIIEVDYSKEGWDAFRGYIKDTNDFTEISLHSGEINQIGKLFRTVFSDIEVNFNPNPIKNIQSSQLDEERVNSIRSNGNLATEIAQLLVDIQISDDSKVAKTARENPGEVINIGELDLKMNRFVEAFQYMFPNKKYSGITDHEKSKKIMFKEFDKDIPLEKLSSGEKQIVFRGAFLLKDQQSTKGSLVLIDEPEISLHPAWQQKILQYYTKLFTDNTDKQTSQMIVSTHSPFIIHNSEIINSKVIILKKDENGKIYIPDEKLFPNWTEEEIVKEAFNLEMINTAVDSIPKNLVVTEGKTDWKHLKRALHKFQVEDNVFHDMDFNFLEYEDDIPMGSPELLKFCKQYSKINHGKKIICIFDRDEPKILKDVLESPEDTYKHWGNQVYSLVIPVPEHRSQAGNNISIEHYYSDSEIKLENSDDRRLFIGNEFSRKFGFSLADRYLCLKKDKCGEDSIAIIDRDSVVSPIENEERNIALSKNEFAELILNEEPPFKDVGHKNFEIIFETIKELIEV
ncbi:AAA family ATPase [Salipaludibacillus sp. CF4.18]|uniref:AAA family ATPase n=1 Tax=Salipaludibacillus sp. CF4.18 TaxID=3373081 RepID=UPI003EE6AD2F